MKSVILFCYATYLRPHQIKKVGLRMDFPHLIFGNTNFYFILKRKVSFGSPFYDREIGMRVRRENALKKIKSPAPLDSRWKSADEEKMLGKKKSPALTNFGKQKSVDQLSFI